MISIRMLILSYTTQEALPNVYAKFQNPFLDAVVAEKSLTKHFMGEK